MTSSLSTSLQLKQTARLSPSQIQVVKLLEIPSVDLMKRINEELENNFALEEGPDPESLVKQEEDIYTDETDYNDHAGEDYEANEMNETLGPQDSNYDDYADYGSDPIRIMNTEQGDNRHTNYSGGTSLYDYLKSQVYLTPMDKPQRHIAKWVLGNIDNSGYLRRSVEQLVDDLSFQENIQISDDEMRVIVGYIKQFDPVGVGAFDLQECLLTQLKAKNPTPDTNNAIRILEHCFDAFTKRHYKQVMERLELSENDMRTAIEVIRHLNQKPANAFVADSNDSLHNQTIIPDFTITTRGDQLVLTLNTGDIPPLHISADYKDKDLSGVHDKEAAKMIKQKVEEAGAFIDAIKQRNETLQRTMAAIMRFQREFFMIGDDACIRPMILQDIADRTGYDPSTISRVSNSKYVQTDFGLFPLKHFFSESMSDSEGNEISTREIKRIILQLVEEEDKQSPMNDDAIVEALGAKGYTLARRTVTKYREQLGIPVARLRKTL